VLVLALLAGAGAAWLFGGKDDVDLSTLTASTTRTTISAAPLDTRPFATTDGLVVHPRQETAVHDSPDGDAFAKVAPAQFGPTWLPVIEQTDGWVRVLLPSKPNRSTGWLPDKDLQRAISPYLIRVHTGSRALELERQGKSLGRWDVAVGTRKTPTPAGRTFVLGSITDRKQSFSPVILPLGSHSPTLDTYGGGPGTVALHGWPRSSVFGSAVSHGCVRVPAGALEKLRRVPLGTLVLIDNK
jgi:lipoprotein-anchoring transpeptidase ErfK/SrfK